MKNILFLSALIFASSTIFGQCCPDIRGVYIYPPHPTSEDSVFAITDVMLPLGSNIIYGEWIYNDSIIHITECYHSTTEERYEHFLDTLYLGKFDDGDYTLNFQSFESSVDDDCIALDSAKISTQFEVGDFKYLEKRKYYSTVPIPNPTRDGITYLSNARKVKSAEVIAPNGEIVLFVNGTRQETLDIDLLFFPAGDYNLRIIMMDESIIFRRLTRL